MRCDKFGCSNLTCNIYDTDLNGECRLYNTIPSIDDVPKPVTPTKPVESSKPEPENKPLHSQSKPTQLVKQIEANKKNKTTAIDKIETPNNSNNAALYVSEQAEERPIQLEMVLSATVNDTQSALKDGTN